MYLNLLVVIIGHQPAQSLSAQLQIVVSFREHGLYKTSPLSVVIEAGAGRSCGQFSDGCHSYSDR